MHHIHICLLINVSYFTHNITELKEVPLHEQDTCFLTDEKEHFIFKSSIRLLTS